MRMALDEAASDESRTIAGSILIIASILLFAVQVYVAAVTTQIAVGTVYA